MSDWLGRTGWKRQQENKNTMEYIYTSTMIKKMDEWRKRKNVNNE
jgi:hypothetical protein